MSIITDLSSLIERKVTLESEHRKLYTELRKNEDASNDVYQPIVSALLKNSDTLKQIECNIEEVKKRLADDSKNRFKKTQPSTKAPSVDLFNIFKFFKGHRIDNKSELLLHKAPNNYGTLS